MPSETNQNIPKVTVVVPVYGDLDSLVTCVQALVRTVDPDRHEVLLVNDCGPDADVIEATLLRLIAEQPVFRYERNDRNLGFVGTCNRAVGELDTSDNDILLLNSDTEPGAGFIEELQSVLYADDSHGVVCARSNNATIASIPYRLTGRNTPRTVERSTTVFNAVRDELPRWSVSPVAMGFCFLVRRTLIKRFGLFDEFFAPGYGEENDFCLRIDQAGYRSIIANRVLVIHEGSKSFVGERRNALRDAHQKKLESRYPYYPRAIRAFMRFGTGPLERFADALVPGSAGLTFGIDVRGLDRVTDPEGRRAVIERVRKTAKELTRYGEVEIFADPADLASLRLNPAKVRQSSEVTTDEVHHVGVLLTGGLDTEQLAVANRRYAHWIAWEIDESARPWDARVGRLGRDVAGDYLKQFSTEHQLGIEALDATMVHDVAERQLRLDVRSTVTKLHARWDAFRLVESVPKTGAGSEATVRRLQAEIGALRDSLSYRLGSKAVRTAKRLARR